MSTPASGVAEGPRHTAFRHEALMYAGESGFMEGALPFLREGIDAGEAMLVVVDATKIRRLRGALGEDADRVRFADMAQVGVNPARIIPAWRDFVDEHVVGGTPMRGIGEPIWPGRSEPELAECHRHEALLNLAFDDTPAFWLLCPYDVAALDPGVVETACGTHPHLSDGCAQHASDRYHGLAAIAAPFDAPLPPAPSHAHGLAFETETLAVVRDVVARRAAAAGVDRARREDLVLAVNELATNSICYGGGRGTLLLWEDGATLLCEVRDGGRIDEPLAGRVRPGEGQLGGYGLWLVNQLCELVQVRSSPTGNVVRIHTRRG